MEKENINRELQQKYDAVFFKNPIPLWIYDIETLKFLEVNQSTLTKYGYSKEEILRMKISEIRPPEEQKKFELEIQNTNFNVPVTNRVSKHRSRSGDDFYVHLTAHPVIFQEKQARLVSVQDITRQLKAEKALKNRESKLQESIAARDKLFSIIAHDLRSPFNAFLNMTELMIDKLESFSREQIREQLRQMHVSATYSSELLQNLLEWSVIQRGTLIPRPSVFRLQSAVSSLLDMNRQIAHNKGITISTQIPEDLTIFADREMISTVLRNISSNAIKFTPEGGEIKMAARPLSGKQIEITVIDSGIGMNTELMNNLFNPEALKTRRGTANESGSGLGLTICREFMEMNNGKIRAESLPGKGTVFFLELPSQE